MNILAIDIGSYSVKFTEIKPERKTNVIVNQEELILDEKPKYIFETKDGEKAYIPVTDVVQQKEPEKEFPQEWFNLVNIPKVVTSNSDRRWTYDDYDRYDRYYVYERPAPQVTVVYQNYDRYPPRRHHHDRHHYREVYRYGR